MFLIPGLLKLLVPFDTLAPNYGAGEPFMRALWQTGFVFQLVALLQIGAGVLLLSNLFVPLAITLLAPIVVVIVGYNLVIAPSLQGIVMASLGLGLELYLAYSHRHIFRPFF